MTTPVVTLVVVILAFVIGFLAGSWGARTMIRERLEAIIKWYTRVGRVILVKRGDLTDMPPGYYEVTCTNGIIKVTRGGLVQKEEILQ